jgi:hypothetical protein
MRDYPTDVDLARIKSWGMDDPFGLAEFIGSIWWMPDFGFNLTGKRVKKLALHTGGWSGNESIIEALEANMFWTLYWRRTDRGGHYYFTIRLLKGDR